MGGAETNVILLSWGTPGIFNDRGNSRAYVHIYVDLFLIPSTIQWADLVIVYLVCVAGVVSGSSSIGHRCTMGERMGLDIYVEQSVALSIVRSDNSRLM